MDTSSQSSIPEIAKINIQKKAGEMHRHTEEQLTTDPSGDVRKLTNAALTSVVHGGNPQDHTDSQLTTDIITNYE